MWKDETPEQYQVRAERVARYIAAYHGSAYAFHDHNGTQTVASVKGYGNWGNSSFRYADAKWKQYEGAAQVVLEASEEQIRTMSLWRFIKIKLNLL